MCTLNVAVARWCCDDDEYVCADEEKTVNASSDNNKKKRRERYSYIYTIMNHNSTQMNTHSCKPESSIQVIQ